MLWGWGLDRTLGMAWAVGSGSALWADQGWRERLAAPPDRWAAGRPKKGRHKSKTAFVLMAKYGPCADADLTGWAIAKAGDPSC